jgi:GR25 family glycosyltransferase involved in LPS biosynthesis
MLKYVKTPNDNNNNWFNYIDVIYYINLDHRSDRNQLFLNEMSKMNVPKNKIVRISGVYKKNQGELGCSASHIIALTKFQKSSFNNCIIFEDDFEFTKNLNLINKAFKEFFTNNIDWNVCCLSANIIYQENIGYNYINKVTSTQTTSGYMVNKKYNNILLENYKEGYELLLKSYDKGKSDHIQGPYCLDQYWKKIQHDNWFVFNPKLGKQRNSDSDIQGGFVIMEVFTDFFL